MGNYDIDINSLTFENIKKIRKYLKKLIEVGGSDLHIKANSIIRARIHGDIVPFSEEVISKDDALTLAKELLRGRFKELVEKKDVDLVYIYDDNTRFRINIFFQIDGVSAVFRTIPIKIKSIDELQLPKTLHRIAKIQRGLVLVTGVTGSGKSTTLAAMLNEINLTERKHIITVEDPVEFVHENNKSLFSHREIGNDTKSFATALKYALREDPDIILIGEMRDKETIAAALTAAETGHLIFGTLHTNSAYQTVNRIIDVFSGDEQPQIRSMLSTSLVSVISQALIPKIGGGRVAVHEILINTPAIANLIRENKVHQIYSQMQLNQQQTGMQTQTQIIIKLLKSRIISKEEAIKYSNRPDELKALIESL